jgi:NADH-quinone oxidoreductase subunit A
MSSGEFYSVGVVAYLALFAGVGVIFLFVNLLVGRFVRPADPHAEKLEIYECGEPTIGSSFVQFDLRFYVVALLFIIFDVEVAFFFPWATVFGKSTQLMDRELAVVEASADVGLVFAKNPKTGQPVGKLLYQELGVRNPEVITQVPASLASAIPGGQDPEAQGEQVAHLGARQLALVTIVDIVVFFAVLMVGFAYVWKRGDLDWVRAMQEASAGHMPRGPTVEVAAEEPVLSA